ncbi:hypothetical protein HII36_33870 [Nonomuraea sp. NN258]|uniref:hypothetical protein n=1 Tax=Nonomuraea antri TaxID=2730852 RepID=UPI001569A6B0|nr:hypothetical protein [Nonomuraea antri]NRQ36789.1 hypothetical protein [Nonomuraea antri]
MSTRSAAVLASGTANAAKLFVGALAFTSAYVGFSAYGNAGSAQEAHTAAAQQPVRTVTLSAREMPITVPVERPPVAGELTVNAVTGAADTGCTRTYLARTLLLNPAGEGVMYGWRLARWSAATQTWRTYLVDHAGFSGAEDAAEWEVSASPGWYRVELSVKGGKTIKSDRFQVSC